jgi:hypothetical protein
MNPELSVLFDDPRQALAAWSALAQTTASTAALRIGPRAATAQLSLKPMDPERLDARRMPPGWRPGPASIDLHLDLAGLYAERRSSPDEPAWIAALWAPDGLLRAMARVVLALLDAGGGAVALHTAAGCVKPAAMMAAQLGDPDDQASCPALAWLDVMTSREERGGRCRTYGMPHAFGLPNIVAYLDALDDHSVARTARAVEYAALSSACAGQLGAALAAPLWWSPPSPPRSPYEGEGATRWEVLPEQELARVMRCPALQAAHPYVLWDRALAAGAPETMPLGLYARALADAAPRQLELPGAALIAAPHVACQPPAHLLRFSLYGMALLLTAGFGRVRAASGTAEQATEHAELAIFGPDDARLARFLLAFGELAVSTSTPGGIKDWDGFPPDASGFGFAVAPLQDIMLGERAIAVRALVPLSPAEYAAYRAEQAREVWFQANIPRREDIAARWRWYLGEG